MTEKRIEEIIEGYTNGNLSWVKREIKSKKDLAAVALHIYLYNREAIGLFLETMAQS